ncbi:hypothetical protein FE257_004657 [Aspergillus nanangensis]|uniref:LYR motif-containing protein Cup1-like N-terminal domain-containing protein n=1 Tax=Aspergillus nanangensis TaxID=2582783 RepID=A0AAD4CYI7_ASPNN|nr:hypothetical protein FE257_004657 [Aspergillus nanangensis]
MRRQSRLTIIYEFIPRIDWLHLYRHLLRECSYLPDPLARLHLRENVQDRFRHYAAEKKFWVIENAIRHHSLWKRGHETLMTLSYANKGQSKHLEKVLRTAYGRRGRRREQMLSRLLEPEVPADTAAVAELIRKPAPYDDGWEPPAIFMNLFKSQLNNGAIAQVGHRQMKPVEPIMPKKCLRGDGIPRNRRRNIRKEWYLSMRATLLPPLPDADLKLLERLIAGKARWKLPQRRVPAGDMVKPEFLLSSRYQEHYDKLLNHTYLRRGPEKDFTFREYADGRPHIITRRFMRRLWQRISCLAPRMEVDATTKKPTFIWDTIKPVPELYAQIKPKHTKIFHGVDKNGKKLDKKKGTMKTKPTNKTRENTNKSSR